MADRHFLIDKTTDGQSTMTVVKPLSEEETVDELARMLGGAEITDSVRQNAKEMRMLAKKNS
jgi:DNA repair protein RecN (Recombination protein N)